MNDAGQNVKRRPERIRRSAMRVEPRRSLGLTWFFLGMGVLVVFGILGARTEGAREMIETRLQRATGLEIEVKASRIGWPYDLVLAAVTLSVPAEAESGGAPLARLDELRIGWRGWRGPAITVRGGQITLRGPADGLGLRWAALADVEDAGAVSLWLETVMGDTVRIQAERIDLVSLDADGRTVSMAESLSLLSLPLRVPRREWRFFEISADRVYRVDGSWITGLRHEWLVSGEAALIKLGYRTASETMQGSDEYRSQPERP